MRTKPQVLISGASIAGPALAFWLCRAGFEVTVVEKAPALREGGYRVDIRGAAGKVMEKMGLMEAVRRQHTSLKGSSLVNRQGKRILDIADPNVFGMRQTEDAEILRGDLSRLLYDVTKEDVLYIFNDTITGLSETEDGILVSFQKGYPCLFDLVIGADGLRSNVRRLVFKEDEIAIRSLGHYVSIFSIPNYFNLDRWELSWAAGGKVINVYGLDKTEEAKAVFMFAAPSPDYHCRDMEGQQQVLREHFSGKDWDADRLLSSLTGSRDFYFDAMCQVKAHRLSKGRVILLGDAGYCPSPASGQGTSMAIVGAYVLAGELTQSLYEGGRNDPYRLAGLRYEREMETFIEKNQALALTVLKEMIPKSSLKRSFQLTMLRIIPTSSRKKLLKKILQGLQESVDEAANAITLKEYPQLGI
jgi:2-polyprenyl-6-methoxyphenol hydroxylase-like FAD-dependent oxidoreductase